jgi:hypothetical protein
MPRRRHRPRLVVFQAHLVKQPARLRITRHNHRTSPSRRKDRIPRTQIKHPRHERPIVTRQTSPLQNRLHFPRKTHFPNGPRRSAILVRCTTTTRRPHQHDQKTSQISLPLHSSSFPIANSLIYEIKSRMSPSKSIFFTIACIFVDSTSCGCKVRSPALNFSSCAAKYQS